MPEVTEEIVDIEDLAKAKSTIDFDQLVRYMLEREFNAGANQDNIGILYVKGDLLTPEFGQEVLSQIDTWVTRKDELQKMYVAAAATTNHAVRFNLEEMPDADIRNTLTMILSNVQVRPAPTDMPDQYKLFTYKESSAMARDNMINNFNQKNNLADFLYKQGVSPDYRPTQDIVEIAILTAYFLKALDTNASPLILPGQSKLFTP